MHHAFRLAAGGIGAEIPASFPVEDGLRDDRSGGIAGAQKQHVVGAVHHALTGLRFFAFAGAQRGAGRHFSGAPLQQLSVRKPSSAVIVSKRAA